jgi:hypothetical protein
MRKEIYKHGLKEYQEMFSDKPTKFDIWWYGHEVYKIGWGFALGMLFMFIIMKTFI